MARSGTQASFDLLSAVDQEFVEEDYLAGPIVSRMIIFRATIGPTVSE